MMKEILQTLPDQDKKNCYVFIILNLAKQYYTEYLTLMCDVGEWKLKVKYEFLLH